MDEFPLDRFMRQLNDLLTLVAENADKPIPKENLTDEVEKKFVELEKQVKEFQDMTNRTVYKMGVSEEEMQEKLAKLAESAPKRTQDLISKSEQLRNVIEEKFSKASKTDKKTKPTTEQSAVSEEQISLSEKKDLSKKGGRKSLFNRVGGKKNWRPL